MELSALHECDRLEKFVHQAYRKSPLGVDLCVSGLCQALRSHRRVSVCTPFPTALFAKNGDKDFASLTAAVQQLPNIHEEFCSSIQSQAVLQNEQEHKETLFKNLPLESLKLLHWLLQLRFDVRPVLDPALELPKELLWRFSWGRESIGGGLGQLPDHILKLQESETKACGPLPTFEDVRSRYGSIFAFHGTSAENLHSILRCGLLILSNSELQRNGSIFGEGIYLSTDPSVALGFCKSGKGWEHSHFGTNAKYLLLCEVAKGEKVLCSGANSEGPKNATDLGTYVIVQNCDLVKLRYVFVYVEPFNVGRHDLNREFQEIESHISYPQFLSRFKRVDWCQLIVLFYVILLLGIGYLKFAYAPKIFS